MTLADALKQTAIAGYLLCKYREEVGQQRLPWTKNPDIRLARAEQDLLQAARALVELADAPLQEVFR